MLALKLLDVCKVLPINLITWGLTICLIREYTLLFWFFDIFVRYREDCSLKLGFKHITNFNRVICLICCNWK